MFVLAHEVASPWKASKEPRVGYGLNCAAAAGLRGLVCTAAVLPASSELLWGSNKL